MRYRVWGLSVPACLEVPRAQDAVESYGYGSGNCEGPEKQTLGSRLRFDIALRVHNEDVMGYRTQASV